jgi:DNA-binding SARP family transcriptional activator
MEKDMQPGYIPAPGSTAHGVIDTPINGTAHAVQEKQKGPFELLHVDDLSVRLLGDFQVRVAGRVIVESDWPLRRARNLMKLLALAPGHQIHREQIIDYLWPEQTQDAAVNNLHKALHVARHVLEPNLPSKVASRYIQLQGELIVLRAPGQVQVDVESLRALAEAAYVDDTPEAYLTALSLYGGDLLPQDPYEDWAILHRERIKHLRLELLLRLARVYEERNEPDSAIQILQQIVEVDHAHEEAHGRLMVLLTRSGARQTALRQYHRLEAALKDELDADPAPAIQQLYQAVLENRLPEQKQDAAFTSVGVTNVRSDAGLPRVIGREQEVCEIASYLRLTAEGAGTLVIIDGEAGSGKTHLMKKMAGYASEQGFTTLMGRASVGTAQPPYFHLSSALADCARRSRAPRSSIAEAANLAHMLAPIPGTPPSESWGGSANTPRPAAVSSLVEDFFKNLCTHAPVLLMLDDVHLADEASHQVVETLATHANRIPLLIVISHCQFHNDRPSPRADHFASTDQHAGVTLTLHPLAFSETAALVHQLLDAPVERSVLEAIHSIAGGVPHYIYETVSALTGREIIRLVEGRWILHPDDGPGLARHHLRQPRLEGTGSSSTPASALQPGDYSRA